MNSCNTVREVARKSKIVARTRTEWFEADMGLRAFACGYSPIAIKELGINNRYMLAWLGRYFEALGKARARPSALCK